MIRLFDAATDAEIGVLEEDQLAALIDAFEEESSDDDEYYVDDATVDMLEDGGADPALVALLRAAVEARGGELDVRWERD